MSDKKLRELKLRLDADPYNLDLVDQYLGLQNRMGYELDKNRLPDNYITSKRRMSMINSIIADGKRCIGLKAKHGIAIKFREIYDFLILYQNKELRKWAEKLIENATIGDPARYAYLMVVDYKSDRKWAERIIENAKTGDPAWFACQMFQSCGSSREWAKNVIENDKELKLCAKDYSI